MNPSALLGELVVPPSALFVLAALGLGLRLVRRRRTGNAVLVVATGGWFALSLPIVAYRLTAGLQVHAPLDSTVERLDADAIVVLGGDLRADPLEYGGDEPGPLSLERARYAARLARRTGLPVLVSGGVLRPDRPALSAHMARFLVEELQVPVRWREERSHDTRENARFSAELLREAGTDSEGRPGRVALVTHAWHMRRAVREFERAGLVVVPAPTAAYPPPEDTAHGFVPRAGAFRMSCWAIHEWIGLLWYRLTG
jgi:uncharacterized SAM-binding protein YcdF (DUF218 family)